MASRHVMSSRTMSNLTHRPIRGIEQLLPLPQSYKSALVLIPPSGLMPVTEKFRKEHDHTAGRWMSNITLVEPFVNEKQALDVDHVTQVVSNIVRHQRPFKVTFDGIEQFVHRGKKCTLWLKLNQQSRLELKNLVDWLSKHLPDFKDVRPHASFTPHLTLGRFDNQKDLENAVTQYRDQLVQETEISFQATEIAWVARSGYKDKMKVQKIFSLGADR